MTKRTTSASPMAWALVTASALTLVSCIGGAAWLGWRIVHGPPPDTTVYDPTKPLHENPRTRHGNYNTEESLEFRWRSADGSSTLHLRIPGDWVTSADGSRPGLGKMLSNLEDDYDDGVASIQLGVWLSKGETGLVATPLKLMLARKAPGQNEIEAPGMHSILTLKSHHNPTGTGQWSAAGSARQEIDFDEKKSKRRLRRLADRYGLERYRAQSCGQSLPANADEFVLLAEEPEKSDGCRDLGNPPEQWVTPRDDPDGAAFKCLLFHGAEDRNPYCYANYSDYHGWRLDYSIPMDHMYQWREVRAALRELIASWEVPPSASIYVETLDEGATP
jgi:hypothetical protein